MASNTFLFDAIVTHVELPNENIEDPAKISVEVKFNRIPVRITGSRMNVTEFKAGRSTEIKTQAEQLRKNIEEFGMPITVRYKGSLIGTAAINFPQVLIDRIDDEMNDLMHVESCGIERKKEIIGNMEVMCRLIVKCDKEPDPEESKSCRNLSRSINPMDILFLMGEPEVCKIPSEPCADTVEDEEGDERLRLDLDRYRSFNRRLNPPEMMPQTCGISACTELKKLTLEYEQVIDSVTKGWDLLAERSPCPNDDNMTQFNTKSCRLCSGATEMNFADESNIPYYSPAREAEDEKLVNQKIMPILISDSMNKDIKPIRFCPVCLTNMSWLPKFAACPRCGLKPTPVLGKHHKKNPGADEIMQEYLGKVPDATDDFCVDPCAGIDPKRQCRCTCKLGKMCAHCRIRKLCADIFQIKDKDKKICPKVAPRSSEDFCVINEDSGDDCRPYLERVFSELRDLYEIKDNQTNLAEFGDQCEKELLRLRNEKKARLAKDSDEQVKSSYGQSYNPAQPLDSKYPSNKMRHKGCMTQDGVVPRRHGWAWTSSHEARKYGWQPGAVLKPIGNIMKYFLQYSPEDNAYNQCDKLEEELKEKERELPILNVTKKNGEIFITLRPIGKPKVNMRPITFKVVKSDLAVALREIKRKLKKKGFAKCTCHKPLMLCVCRSYKEKKELQAALDEECALRRMSTCVEHLVLTDTSESEMEFTFDVTPPGGVVKPPPPRSPYVINHGTQTAKNPKEEPKYPIKINPYYGAYDCAVGDRYRGTAFGKLVEDNFEDGVFGYEGGGLHGEPAAPGGRKPSKKIWGPTPGGPMRFTSRNGPVNLNAAAWRGIPQKIMQKMKKKD